MSLLGGGEAHQGIGSSRCTRTDAGGYSTCGTTAALAKFCILQSSNASVDTGGDGPSQRRCALRVTARDRVRFLQINPKAKIFKTLSTATQVRAMRATALRVLLVAAAARHTAGSCQWQQLQSAVINLHVRRCTPHLKSNFFGSRKDESKWKPSRRGVDAVEPLGPHFGRAPH